MNYKCFMLSGECANPPGSNAECLMLDADLKKIYNSALITYNSAPALHSALKIHNSPSGALIHQNLKGLGYGV